MPRPVADLFLMNFTDGSGVFEVLMNVSDVLSVPQSGDAADAVEALVATPYLAKQLDTHGPDAIREFLRPYGAWNTEELADDAQNRRRCLWLVAGGLHDELFAADMLDVMQETFEY